MLFRSTIEVGYKMLELPNHKRNKTFRNTVHGELCETILEICIIDFMKQYSEETKEWVYDKGMVIKDITNMSSNFRTEIDLTLFTPFKILSFECKSYSGDKEFINECTVRRKGIKDCDVYNQHRNHYVTLMKTMKPFRLRNEYTDKIAPMQVAYFDFSLGSKVDNRDKKWRALMPIITVNNIHKLLTTYLDKPRCWDMSYINRALKLIDRNKELKTKKHLEYVKSLHGKR